jgi:hypothetical protein
MVERVKSEQQAVAGTVSVVAAVGVPVALEALVLLG